MCDNILLGLVLEKVGWLWREDFDVYMAWSMKELNVLYVEKKLNLYVINETILSG